MSLYNIISTGSGEIINIFEWNGIDEIFIPPGYIASLNTTESIEIPIAYEDIVSSSMDNILTDIFVGESYGSLNSKYIDTVAITADTLISKNIVNSGVIITSGSTEFSGSVNITGSLFINDKKIETLFNNTKYGRLALDSTPYAYYSMTVCPPIASFRFPTVPQDWTQKVHTITMSAKNTFFTEFDSRYTSTIEQYRNYVVKLITIIDEGNSSCIMTIRSVEYPNTFKKFRIVGGQYYIENTAQGCAVLDWGAKTGPNSITTTPLDNCNRFTDSFFAGNSVALWPESSKIWTNKGLGDFIDPSTQAYFHLEVIEIESNYEWYKTETNFISGIQQVVPALPTEQPRSGYYDETENDFFDIDFECSGDSYRKEIHVIETSQEFTIPSWVNKTSIYAIGAGGGGGGGTAGFMHSDNLPIIKSGWSGRYAIDGLPKSFGHELLSGGGGGAGGNVSIGEFDRADIPPGSILQLIVGSGGLGGSGYGFANSNNTDVDLISMVTNIQNPDDSYAGVRNNRDVFETFSNFLQIPQMYKWFNEPESSLRLGAGYFYEINKFFEKNDGKRGGFSAAILKSTPTNPNVMQTIIQADGGLGGRAGLGVRSYFMDDQFRLMTPNKFTRTEDCIDCETTYLNQYWVPGGGSTMGSSLSPQNKVYLGGPGGYGITMGSVRADYDIKALSLNTYATRQDYGKVVTKTLKRNTAPPQKWEENTELPDLKLPYGDSGLKRQSPETMQKSSYPAPTGGGGGAGKVMFAMENRLLSEEGTKYFGYLISDDPNIISSRQIYTKYSLDKIDGRPFNSQRSNENIGFPNDTIFDDYYKDFAIKINVATTLGEGGKFISSNILLDDYDTNGVRHTVLLGRGGNGGYDVSNNPHASLAGFKSNILPSNGSGDLINGFGGGGGGGAARFTPNVYYDGGDMSTVGQDGADGGKGVVIIVLES